MQIPSEYDNKTPKEHWRACVACCSRRKTPAQLERYPNKRTGLRMTLGAVLQLFAAIGGINTLSYYLPTVAESNIGMTVRASNIVVTACTTWLVFCAVLGVFVIDRLGRRGTIMLAFTGLFLCSIILLGLMLAGLGVGEDLKMLTAASSATLAFIFLFEGFWGLLNPAAWLYQAEIDS